MNPNINFHNSNDLNISNSSEKDLNDILTEDLLTYSEDRSQSLLNMQQLINSNNRMIDNHNQSLKNLIPKIGVNIQSKNNQIPLTNQVLNLNEYKIKNNNLQENNIRKRNTDINTGNNKDLSTLQISLSNLLSDNDSKDIFNQNNKIKELFNNNNINQVEKNENYEKHNFLIDISNENANSSILNYNTNTNNNTNNNTLKNKNIQKEEQSSLGSVCNYSQSLYISNNNINNSNINNNKYNTGSNYLIKTNNNKSNNSLKYNKEQNINIFINPKEKEKQNIKIKEKIINNNLLNDDKINNNENIQISSPFKNNKYQFEKGESIQLSIISNLNKIYKDNVLDNYNNSLSINKGQYFTINNSTFNNNFNSIENNEIIKKNNTTSLKIIKEQIKFNKKKNGKLKLINNKNIDIQKNESKNFFYNPKLNNIINQLNYNNKNINNISKNKKTDINLNFINKTELSELHIDYKQF